MFIVGVTSCATGIAHTYMAAEAMRKACKKRGIECKFETQGSLGIENKLTAEDIKRADKIVFANDVQITDEGRFKGYEDKIFKTGPHEVLSNAEIIF